jgi:hypothetical protein
MILYNVTVSIDERIHEEWLDWMKTKHDPDVMATGCFIESRISRVHGDEEGGLSFAISYLCQAQEDYDRYAREYAEELQREHAQKYNGQFAAFRTMLTVLEEFKV